MIKKAIMIPLTARYARGEIAKVNLKAEKDMHLQKIKARRYAAERVAADAVARATPAADSSGTLKRPAAAGGLLSRVMARKRKPVADDEQAEQPAVEDPPHEARKRRPSAKTRAQETAASSSKQDRNDPSPAGKGETEVLAEEADT